MRKVRTHNSRGQSSKQMRWTLPVLLALALLGINLISAGVAARTARIHSSVTSSETTIPFLAGTLDLLTSAAGDQTDAHLDCDIASYTTDESGTSEIKYHDLNFNVDRNVPASGVDSQSSVSRGRIAFTETTTNGSFVDIFDTSTQTRTTVADVTPGKESNPAIGGELVAFEDRSYSINPNMTEIAVYELDANFYTRLTSDSLLDKNPAVSPDGNVIVWEKCQATGLNCDIYSAIKKGSGLYQTQALTGAGEDRGPATNGQIVAYVSDKNGDNDIYYQPVGGGSETQIPIPGDQRNLSISGNLMAFESQVMLDDVPEYDIFVYDLRTTKIYQVTDTAVDEALNDISTCNDKGRIVFSAPQSGYDIFSFTFQVPKSPADEINDLIQLMQTFNLPRGVESRLMAKLQDALNALSVGNTGGACDSLTSFINTSQALPGKKLTSDQVRQLVEGANKIKVDLGCQ